MYSSYNSYGGAGGGDRHQKPTANRNSHEAAQQRKATNDTQYFWDLVNRHMAGQHVGPRRLNRSQEEHHLFAKKSETASTGFIDDSTPVERSGPRSEEIPCLESFESLRGSVPASVIRSIELLRYETPTLIQKHAIPLGLAGMDLMCCAQTGSGKTFAFLVPVVAAMDPVIARQRLGGDGAEMHEPISIDRRGVLPRAIVLAPTRELASQIQMDARRLTFGSNTRSVCVYGGNDIRTQLQELCMGCEIIVATPGRLNDLVDRGCVSLAQVCFLVLDEADRMLDMGFEPQIRKIVQDYDMPRSGEARQTFMFSATFPPEIQALAREFLYNYVWIAVGRVGSTVENIKQQVLLATSDPNKKMELLVGVLNQTDGRTLIFVQKKRTATWLVECLRSMYGVTAEEIHGDRSQSQREHALKMFRDGHVRILVATDVAARGLDVPAVMHVVQFDMPLSPEDFDVYVHRIGRTGRAGMPGLATSFFVPGRELGEGNGKIGAQLMQLLQENNQEVPDWFSQIDEGYGHRGSRGGAGYHPRGAPRFGFRDTRSNQHNMTYAGQSAGGSYSTNGGGYGGNPRGASGYAAGGRGIPINQGMPPSNPNGYGVAPAGAVAGGMPAAGGHYPPAPALPQQQPVTSPVAAVPVVTVPGYSQQPPPPPTMTTPSPYPPQQQQAPAPNVDSGGYYDPYSGTFIPGNIAAAVAAPVAVYGNAMVDQMTGQFGGMSMQQPGLAPHHQQQQWMMQQAQLQQQQQQQQSRQLQQPQQQMYGGGQGMGGYGNQAAAGGYYGQNAHQGGRGGGYVPRGNYGYQQQGQYQQHRQGGYGSGEAYQQVPYQQQSYQTQQQQYGGHAEPSDYQSMYGTSNGAVAVGYGNVPYASYPPRGASSGGGGYQQQPQQYYQGSRPPPPPLTANGSSDHVPSQNSEGRDESGSAGNDGQPQQSAGGADGNNGGNNGKEM